MLYMCTRTMATKYATGRLINLRCVLRGGKLHIKDSTTAITILCHAKYLTGAIAALIIVRLALMRGNSIVCTIYDQNMHTMSVRCTIKTCIEILQ